MSASLDGNVEITPNYLDVCEHVRLKRPAQLQKLDLYNNYRYSIQRANNKDSDQTARAVCIFDVPLWHET